MSHNYTVWLKLTEERYAHLYVENDVLESACCGHKLSQEVYEKLDELDVTMLTPSKSMKSRDMVLDETSYFQPCKQCFSDHRNNSWYKDDGANSIEDL